MNEKQNKADKLAMLRKQKEQAKKELDFRTKEVSIRERMYEFEKAHCKIVDGKPEWLTLQGYMDLTMEMKELQHEASMVQIRDGLARAKLTIEGLDKEIIKVDRNIETVKEVEAEVVDEVNPNATSN